jgi:hypothetical protein
MIYKYLNVFMHVAVIVKGSDFILMALWWCSVCVLRLANHIVIVVSVCIDVSFWWWSLRPRQVKDERLKTRRKIHLSITLNGVDNPKIQHRQWTLSLTTSVHFSCSLPSHLRFALPRPLFQVAVFQQAHLCYTPSPPWSPRFYCVNSTEWPI